MNVRQKTIDIICARNYKKEAKSLLLKDDNSPISLMMQTECCIETDTGEKAAVEEFIVVSPKEYAALRDNGPFGDEILKILRSQVFAVISLMKTPQKIGKDKLGRLYIKTKRHYYRFEYQALVVDGRKVYMYDAVNIGLMLLGRKPFSINGEYKYIGMGSIDNKWVNKQRGATKMKNENKQNESTNEEIMVKLVKEDETPKAPKKDCKPKYREEYTADDKTILISSADANTPIEDMKKRAIRYVAINRMIDMLDTCIYPQKLPFSIRIGEENGTDILILESNNLNIKTSTENISINGIVNLISKYSDIFRTTYFKELLLPEEQTAINTAINKMKDSFIENHNDYFILDNDICLDEYIDMIEKRVQYYKISIQSRKILEEWLNHSAAPMRTVPTVQLLYGDDILTDGYKLSSNSILILFIMDIEKGFAGIFAYFKPSVTGLQFTPTLDTSDANCRYLVRYDTDILESVKEVLRRIYQEFSYSIISDYVDMI